MVTRRDTVPDRVPRRRRDTLGFEVRNDVEHGGMHWITVGPPDQPGTSIVLTSLAASPGIPTVSAARSPR